KIRAVILSNHLQPLTKLRNTLGTHKQFELIGACQTMPEVIECIQQHAPELLLLDGEPARSATQLAVRRRGRTVFVKVQELDYIQAALNEVLLHTSRSCHRIRTTLRALGKKLPTNQFFRVNRSVIVNLDRVREVRRTKGNGHVLVLRTGKQLPLTRQ